MINHETFEKALLQALKPLIRIALKRGVEFREFSETVRTAYVEVVQDDFRVPGRKLTVARVALLTGLTRRESSRIVKASNGERTERMGRKKWNRSARVFRGWSTDPKFLDRRGNPAALDFDGDHGATFTDLVRENGADVTARVVLDELLRVGAVDRLKDGRIRALDRAYAPLNDDGEKLAILGSDVADLIGAIEHNLDPDAGEPFFQRKVAYDNLPADYLASLRKRVRKDAQALLERLSADMSKHDRDVIQTSETDVSADRSSSGRPPVKRHRAMLGIYYFEEETRDKD